MQLPHASRWVPARPLGAAVQKIAVLATGGTIASRRRADGSSVAAAGADELVASLPSLPDVEVVLDDVFRIGSYRMTLERMAQLATRACDHLADGAAGAAVTPRTDTHPHTPPLHPPHTP